MNFERAFLMPSALAPEATPPSSDVTYTEAAGSELEVMLVEDDLTMRRGLELILRDEGMRVVGVATDAGQARSLIARRRIDVALITAGLAGEHGARLVSELLAVSPTTAVVLYGMSGEPELLAEMQASGARAIVLKASEPSVLLCAIRTAAVGGTHLDPAATGPPDRARLGTLSAREREILGMLAVGHTARSIADELSLSPETVRTHVVNARRKLGAKTRVQAVALSVSDPGH